MKSDRQLQERIRQYLNLVKDNLNGAPRDVQEDILAGVEAHIHDALRSRGDEVDLQVLEAVLAEMDAPESYAELAQRDVSTSKRRRFYVPSVVVVGLLCGLVGGGLFALVNAMFRAGLYEYSCGGLRRVELIDSVFRNDPAVLGKWMSVDFVERPELFDPAERKWAGDLYWKEMVFFPEGKMSQPWFTWSSNCVFHSGDKTISHYSIKSIGGREYLFYQWMSGDVKQRKMAPRIYVLVRESQSKVEDSVYNVAECTTFDLRDPATYAWLNTNRYIAPDFEAFFPDDPEGGQVLDALFEKRNAPGVSDNELLEAVRMGLRNTKNHRENIIRWIGNRYIWGKSPQHPAAVEILYHAAQPDDAYGTRHYAVYFGLSVLTNRPSNVLQTMANICLRGEDCGRILWGLGRDKRDLLPFLQPRLSVTTDSQYETAVALNRAVRGEIDMDQWLRERKERQTLDEYSDRLPEIRENLMNGTSMGRMENIGFLLRNYALMNSMDESDIEAWAACAKDPDVGVRREVARLVGGRYLWRMQTPSSNAVELIYQLSYDVDSGVRYNCIYHGLSTLRNKNDAILKRFIELWISSSYDNNLHGRILWALRAPKTKERVEELLLPCLAASQSPDVRAQALQMYLALFETEPPNAGDLANIGEFKCVFRASDGDDHAVALKQVLPDSLSVENLSNEENHGQTYGVLTFTGLGLRSELLELFNDHPQIELLQMMPEVRPVEAWTYDG